MNTWFALFGLVSLLVCSFLVTLVGRYVECRIQHEYDPVTSYRSHQAIREECKTQMDPFFLFRT